MRLFWITVLCVTIFYYVKMQSLAAKISPPDITMCPTCCGPPPCCSPCISCDAGYIMTGEFCNNEGSQCLDGEICKMAGYYGICCKLGRR